jgi:non-ribosomal peptide synthetase component E (peptide arylation enzyme)
VAHVSALKGGHVSTIMRRFELESFLAHIEKFEINETGTVPPIVIAIIMSGLAENKYSMKTLKAVTVGAAPLGKDAQVKFKSLLALGARCNQVWGM